MSYSANIDSSKLTIEKTKHPQPKPPKETLKFGHTFSDHMLEVDWEMGKGWTAPKIVPFHNLSLSPAASSLHYALQCFEGLKAYVDDNNKVRLFRPDRNMARLNGSMQRLDFPNFDGPQFLECIKKTRSN
jgi:branched-chain amino acid aminotransferase